MDMFAQKGFFFKKKGLLRIRNQSQFYNILLLLEEIRLQTNLKINCSKEV